MSDPTTTPPDATPPKAPNWRRRIRLSLIAALAIVVIGAGISAVTQVNAFGRMGWHGHGDWNDPARVDAGVERLVKHFAVEIDATDDQQAKLTEIAKSAVKDLLPLRKSMRTAGRNATALLTAAQIDRPAIEKLRAAQLQSMQLASTRLTQFLADAAEVLTVPQRQQLAEFIAEHRRHRDR